MQRQSEHPAPSAIAGQPGPPNLIALPSSTPVILVTVAIALLLLTYLGAQTLRWGTAQSSFLAGLTKAELLDARADPMLMESDIGVSAAIVSQLRRVCNGLPAKSERDECRTAIYPDSKPAPKKLAESPPVRVLEDSESLGDPKISQIKMTNFLSENAPSGWTVRRVSYSVSEGGGQTKVPEARILWFRPKKEVRAGCGYQNPASDDSHEVSAASIATFFERLGSATSGGGVDLAGLGTGHVGRAYIMFPSGDIMTWVPPDQRNLEDELHLLAGIPTRNACLINRSLYFRPLPPGAMFRYTGLYLDAAGLGFNATVFAPINFLAEERPVAAIDLTFDPNLLAGRTGSLSELVSLQLQPGVSATWKSVLDGLVSLNSRAANDLRDRVNDCLNSDPGKDITDGRLLSCPASPQPPNGGNDSSASASNVGSHAIAVYLGQSKWLVAYLPRDAESNPLLPALIALGLVGSAVWLIARLLKSHATLRTLVSTLDTMNVPLLVSDPNSDHVSAGNETAARNGLAPVGHFGKEVVDIEDQAMYAGTQVPGRVSRAYIVRIKLHSDPGAHWALFRSAPIVGEPGYLSARPGDRLTVVLPMDPDSDIAPFARAIENAIRFEFTDLLDHGLLVWTRALQRIIETDHQLAATLVKLIERNQTFIRSLFLWDKQTTALPRDIQALDETSVRSTVDLCMELFAAVAADEATRRDLDLGNGTLFGCRENNAPFQVQRFEWPERAHLHVPIEGALGFFLAEGLRNAVRHGKPGTTPVLIVASDALSEFLRFEIRNELLGIPNRAEKSLGGVDLMRKAARILGWKFDSSQDAEERRQYLCWWEIPLVQRSQA